MKLDLWWIAPRSSLWLLLSSVKAPSCFTQALFLNVRAVAEVSRRETFVFDLLYGLMKIRTPSYAYLLMSHTYTKLLWVKWSIGSSSSSCLNNSWIVTLCGLSVGNCWTGSSGQIGGKSCDRMCTSIILRQKKRGRSENVLVKGKIVIRKQMNLPN